MVGSLPPGNGDLDLLVRSDEAEAIEVGLSAQGFEGRDGVWARFEGCRPAQVVDLTDAESWRLPPAELESLFAEAVPIEPSGHVCRPAPHHALLVVARRAMREGPRIRRRRLRRVAAELREDVDAFEVARARAVSWGASRSIDALERSYRSGARISAATRRRAACEELSASRGRLGASVGAWRVVLRRPRWGALVVVSGPDADARRRQADHLVEALRRIGFDTEQAATGARSCRAAAGCAISVYSAMLKGTVVVYEGAPAGPPAGKFSHRVASAMLGLVLPRPRIVHLLDPVRTEEELCAGLPSATWAALSG